MIKIELEVTAQQLIDIAAVLNGGTVTQEFTVTATPAEDDIEQSSPATAFAAVPTTDVKADDQQSNDTPPPPVTTDVELGKSTTGIDIPWDARIHGKAKKKNAGGDWRLIQGVDRETLVPQVEAELVAAMNAAPPAPDSSGVPAALATAQSATNDAPPPPAAGKPTTFAELLPLVTAGKANGEITDEKIEQACQQIGLPNFGMIATRPDLIETMADLLGV